MKSNIMPLDFRCLILTIYSFEKYFLASCMTFGANNIVAIMVGIAINAKKPSIRLMITSRELIAPTSILDRYM